MQPEMPRVDTMTQDSNKSRHSTSNWDILIWNIVKGKIGGIMLNDICLDLGAGDNEEETLVVKRKLNDLIELGLVVQKGIKYHKFNDRTIGA